MEHYDRARSSAMTAGDLRPPIQ